MLSLSIAREWAFCHSVSGAGGDSGDFRSLNRFPRMVQEYFVRRVHSVEEAADQRRAALHTSQDAEDYVRSVREKIQSCFGPWPEKTPLNPRITGTVERDGYRIENVIFESRPGFLVTANLYLPKGKPLPAPAVVGACGHSTNGKAEEAYQSFSQGLARQGYVVLIYDPIGQGERLQYPDGKGGSTIGVGVREHIQAGNQQFLVGESIASWRAWDGIRALDYLLTRKEVDSKRVGVTGNSGGGTMTTWLCGVESRWSMAAPSCFVTTFRRNLENELPADTEQCPPDVLAAGLDHSDFLAAMAPKPVIILAKERDFFDGRGVEQAYARLKKLYRLLGAEENIGLFVGPTYHGYSQENREAMYQWFHRTCNMDYSGREPELTLEKDETLWCCPNGQVSELGSRSVPSFTREISRQLAGRRSSTISAKNLKKALIGLCGLPIKLESGTAIRWEGRLKPVPEFRILRNRSSRNYPKSHAIAYAVETEPGIRALVYRLSDERLYSRPPRSQTKAFLYVPHLSSDDELRNESLIAETIQSNPESVLYTCDPRGTGESQPVTCGPNSFLNPYGSDYFYSIHSIMLGHPYVGMKTFDILRVLEWVKIQQHIDIHLLANGRGCLPAVFAALLSDSVTQITLKGAPGSFSEIAETEAYDWPLSVFLPHVLKHFDLPDCYRELSAKGLRLIT